MAAIEISHLEKVKDLYFNQNKSAIEIAEILNVSIDAVYYFMRHHKIVRRSASQQSKIRFDNKKPSFKIKEILSLRDEKLRVAGTMLYWGEGFQSEQAKIVDFANSKPEMIAVFIRFLREICGIDESKLRAYLYCYSNQNVGSLIRFWSSLTGIPKKQFTKPYIRHDFDIKKSGKMKYGMIHIRYGDKKLLSLIREWIKGYGSDLII